MKTLSESQTFTARQLLEFAESNWSAFNTTQEALGIPEDATEADFESLKAALS